MPSDPTEREWLEGIGERFQVEDALERAKAFEALPFQLYKRVDSGETVNEVVVESDYVPASIEEIAQVLEGMGAKRDATAFRQLGTEGLFGWRVEVDGPGSYLVLPLPTPQEEK